MTFASDLSPFLLLFALLPLAIYLLFRRRYHKRTFGAMHILHRAYRKVRRSLRVKEMILLALRTLALVVLVLALLQPVLSDALGSENTAWLFVLDSSLSMRATNPSGSRFRAAKDFISSRIEYSARGDRFALLPFDDEPGELLGPVDDADSARAISEKLQPGYAATAITPKLLEKIITLAAEAAKDGYVPHVMFVSDLAANPWGGLSSSPQLLKLFDKLADTALITFVDCSKGISENLSVKSLEPSRDLFCSGLDVDITAAVVNHSARETSSVLAIDREEFALTSDSLTLNAGSQGELSARERPDSQGPVFYRASLPDDVLVEDNVRLLAARVRDRLSVLIVDGRASRKNFENASSFLKHALRPSTREGLSPLIPAVIDLAQLETAQLDNTDVLVLASVPGLTDGSAKKVERFVSRGGALVVTCGEGTNRDGLHRALGDILPVILDETVTAADGEWFPAGSMRLPDTLEGLKALYSAGFKSLKLFSFMQSRPKRNAQLLVTTQGGQPLLAVGPHEKGTVAFFASSFDGSWCNLPVLPMFPPLVHELCYFCLNSGTDDLNTLTGGSVQIPFEIADASGPAKLLLPSGSSLELLLDVKSKNLDISGDVLREPGIYTVRFANDREVVFAVNVPASEGDLTALSSNALKGMFENFSPRYVLASDTPHETDAALPDDLRRALFVAALALLLLEMLLASLFSRQPARTTLSIETEVFSQ